MTCTFADVVEGGEEAYHSERKLFCLALFTSGRQLPARDVLDFLPKIRSQTRASFRSRAARACALPASLSLLCVS